MPSFWKSIDKVIKFCLLARVSSSNFVANVLALEAIQDNLLSSLEAIQAPRSTRTQKHLLKDILVIAILAAIAGAEGWEDMENYGLSKYSELKEFLELPNGIPSDDPFRRVFERLIPEQLEQVLHQNTGALKIKSIGF